MDNSPMHLILRDDRIWNRALIELERIRFVRVANPLYEVIIREYKKNRSLEANARLWALHEAASKHTGYTPEDMHQLCKAKFLGTLRVTVKNETREVPRSSAKLNTSEFHAFMENVELWYAQELGVSLEQEPYAEYR